MKPQRKRGLIEKVRNYFTRNQKLELLENKIRELAAVANFQAAGINRLTQSWTQTTLSPDSQARSDLKIVRNRSRQLRDNNDYAQCFATMLKTNVLGEAGIHFRNKAKDPDMVKGGKVIPGNPDIFANKIIADKFYKWGLKQYCTVTGKLNWVDVQNIALETVAFDGEILVRKIKTSRDVNPFGFTLQLMESDYLDDDFDTVLPNGNEVRMGVELDQWKKTVAYHLRTENPNDTGFNRRTGNRRYRVAASEMIHLGKFTRAEQTRCMPWLATAAYRMNMLGKYEEAEVTAARAAACKMGFLIPKEDPNAQYEGEADSDGNKMMEAEPGSLEQLPSGMDLKSLDWNHPNSSYQVFMKTALRGIASGLGVSYNSLANDMEAVNFASGKLGLDFERRVWKRIQYWMIENFHEEVFSAWLESALTTQEIPLPIGRFEKFNAPEFRGPRWAYINPQQEVEADVKQLRNRTTSLSRILAERNIDRDELFDEIADDERAAKERGIVLSEPEQQAELDAMVAMASQPEKEMHEDEEEMPIEK
jgi:lambda family phage portal protein